MRRDTLLALVAALALTIGLSTTASAGVSADAQATAKKKAAKNCGKKKAKKKAGKSLADSAAKKGKKKASKCKAKPNKGKAKPKPTPPKQQDPKGPAGASFGDGTYKDAAQSVTVTVTNNGQQVAVGFPGGSCVGNALLNVQGPIAQQGSDVKGSGAQSMLGGAGSVNWSLTVSPSRLSYKFDATTKVQFPDQDPCQSAKNAAGTLVKQ